MKSACIAALAAGSVVAAALLLDTRAAWSAPETAAYEADLAHSYVVFRIRHMGVSWQYGRFNDFTASVEAGDGGDGVRSVAFTVKTESVDTGNPKRDQHLRTPDFFSAKQFPEITFKSTSVKAGEGGASEVTGDLTLHGVTKSVTAKVVKVGAADLAQMGYRVGYEAELKVKRSDFGMSKSIGDGSDEVSVTVAVETVRK